MVDLLILQLTMKKEGALMSLAQMNWKEYFSKVNLFCLLQFETLTDDEIQEVLTKETMQEFKAEISDYLVNDLKFSNETLKTVSKKQKRNYIKCHKCKNSFCSTKIDLNTFFTGSIN